LARALLRSACAHTWTGAELYALATAIHDETLIIMRLRSSSEVFAGPISPAQLDKSSEDQPERVPGSGDEQQQQQQQQQQHQHVAPPQAPLVTRVQRVALLAALLLLTVVLATDVALGLNTPHSLVMLLLLLGLVGSLHYTLRAWSGNQAKG